MLNSKETLKKLHKKFPTLSLDELFDIVDCYVEEGIHFNSYKNYTVDPFSLKDWTVTCDYPKDSAANQILSKLRSNITFNADTNQITTTSNY